MATCIPRLEKRISPCKPCSKTGARQPRTFTDILPWQEFAQGSRELFDSLDNTQRLYTRTVYDIMADKSMDPAADEGEVRGLVVIVLLKSVNTAAKRLGIAAQYAGGGSGRSLSFTDLVVRPAGAHSDSADLSKQILGTGRVKGDWQWELRRGERLQDALHDPERSEGIVQAVQQVGLG